MIAEQDGRKFVFSRQDYPHKHEWYLCPSTGKLHQASLRLGYITAIFVPVPTIREFGGVRFEEVEVRVPRNNEWFITREENIILMRTPTNAIGPRMVLKPCK